MKLSNPKPGRIHSKEKVVKEADIQARRKRERELELNTDSQSRHESWNSVRTQVLQTLATKQTIHDRILQTEVAIFTVIVQLNSVLFIYCF